MTMRVQTITVNATPGDATKAAEVVAANLRAQGFVVVVGPEFTQPRGHKAGMLSVDLAIDAAPVGIPSDQVVSAETTVVVGETTAVPFDDGIDLSRGPDATDDEGRLIGYAEERRAERERKRKAKT